jgi:hypothetical protein
MQIRLVYRNLYLSYKYMLISFIICISRWDVETASFSLEILLQTLKLPIFSRKAIWVIVMYTPVAKEHKEIRCFMLHDVFCSSVYIIHTV